LCLHPGRGFPGEMTQRFVAMLGCGSCHVRGCHESCSLRFAGSDPHSLRFASSDPHSLRFASSDPQAVIVRYRPQCSRATTANADRLIAGCLITSAAPLRFLLSISKYLPYLNATTRLRARPLLQSLNNSPSLGNFRERLSAGTLREGSGRHSSEVPRGT